MKYYPQFTWDYVMDELPMLKGWALVAVAMSNSEWLQFSGLRLKGKGYIGKEAESLVEMAKQSFKERGI